MPFALAILIVALFFFCLGIFYSRRGNAEKARAYFLIGLFCLVASGVSTIVTCS